MRRRSPPSRTRPRPRRCSPATSSFRASSASSYENAAQAAAPRAVTRPDGGTHGGGARRDRGRRRRARFSSGSPSSSRPCRSARHAPQRHRASGSRSRDRIVEAHGGSIALVARRRWCALPHRAPRLARGASWRHGSAPARAARPRPPGPLAPSSSAVLGRPCASKPTSCSTRCCAPRRRSSAMRDRRTPSSNRASERSRSSSPDSSASTISARRFIASSYVGERSSVTVSSSVRRGLRVRRPGRGARGHAGDDGEAVVVEGDGLRERRARTSAADERRHGPAACGAITRSQATSCTTAARARGARRALARRHHGPLRPDRGAPHARAPAERAVRAASPRSATASSTARRTVRVRLERVGGHELRRAHDDPCCDRARAHARAEQGQRRRAHARPPPERSLPRAATTSAAMGASGSAGLGAHHELERRQRARIPTEERAGEHGPRRGILLDGEALEHRVTRPASVRARRRRRPRSRAPRRPRRRGRASHA